MEHAVKVWQILDILKVTESALRDRGIRNPRLNAELLLCDTLKCRRIELYLDFEKPLNNSEISEYRDKVKRRLKHEPLQYILGKAEFFGLTFRVSPAVLIPRQETEILVEEVIKNISGMRQARVLEIGTGSGCISIALASKLDCAIDAIDISPEALEIAKENSDLNKTSDKINFIQKDILTGYEDLEGYDVIISNPPYIPGKEMESLDDEVRMYEPGIALTDSGDGMTFYRRILELGVKTKHKIKIFMELGDRHAGAIQALLKKMDITAYSIKADLMKIPRVLIVEIN
jgi:release factor glutamine methyltransferase